MTEERQFPPQGGLPTSVGRLGSIDALRGLDMWFITGGSAFLTALGYLITGRPETWISVQMCHVPWEGLRICDVIFPLFLFLSGVSFPFSLAKRRAEGATTGAILRHILVRTLVLVGWGLLCCRIQYWEWSTFRTWSVLGRVGIAWGVAATLWTLCRPRTCVIVTVGLLVAWWLFLSLVPSPNAVPGACPMGAGGANCMAVWLDRFLTYKHRFEGGFPTVVMPTLALLGIFAGTFLRWRPGEIDGNRRALLLFGAGVVCMALGGLMAVLPGPLNLLIVKGVFSTSFNLLTCGIGAALLAVFYWLIDVKGYRAWSLYFRVIGANALAIYLSQRLVDWAQISSFFMGAIPKLDVAPAWYGFCRATGALVVSWIALWFLYRRKVFIRI